MSHIKKLLCMMLTVTMILNIMVIGAGAVFNDQYQITHTDAVEKLVSWNIIKGKDQGNFDPNGYVTRAEMCKMICIALNGGKEPSLSTRSTPTYWDTKGHWGEKYIEYCSGLGVVAGSGNGEFQPDAYVTGYQAAKMALTAMGFNATNEGFTGSAWAINTAMRANVVGLFKDINSTDFNFSLNRDNAAQLIYNGVMSPTPQYTNGTQSALTGKSIYSQYFQNSTPTPTPSTSFESYVSGLGSATSIDSAVSPYTLNQFMKIPRNNEKDTYYKINLQEGEGIAVALRAQINSGNLYLYLYDSNGHTLDAAYGIKNDEVGIVEWTAKQDMTIYVDISGTTGIYYLGFYDAYFNSGVSDSDRDFYGSPYTAKSIENGTYVRDLEDKDDWYRVYVNEKETITVNITPSLNSGHLYLHIYDKDGNNLDADYSVYDGEEGTVEKTVATSGYYFIDVYGAVGKYKLTYSVS